MRGIEFQSATVARVLYRPYRAGESLGDAFT